MNSNSAMMASTIRIVISIRSSSRTGRYVPVPSFPRTWRRKHLDRCRGQYPAGRSPLRSTTVVVPRRDAIAIQISDITNPTTPTAIRMSPTMCQLTWAVCTVTANRRIAPTAISTMDVPIPIFASRSSTRVLATHNPYPASSRSKRGQLPPGPGKAHRDDGAGAARLDAGAGAELVQQRQPHPHPPLRAAARGHVARSDALVDHDHHQPIGRLLDAQRDRPRGARVGVPHGVRERLG